MKNSKLSLDIGSVERETGIGKDALRMWEKRYGFPQPSRNMNGERLYPQEQVDRLRLIKCLMGNGMRPSRIVGLQLDELTALMGPVATGSQVYPDEAKLLLGLIKEHQAPALQLALSRMLLQKGLHDFLTGTIAPLNQLVGEAWMQGEIHVFEEHLYSGIIMSVLRNAISSINDPGGSPKVLLTTLPGEAHILGLLMAEATLCMNGADCVTLGAQTPIQDLVSATRAHCSDIVVLSFSSAANPTLVKSSLLQVRKVLPQNIQLWVGGEGVSRTRMTEEGIRLMGPLTDLTSAVDEWRKMQPESGQAPAN